MITICGSLSFYNEMKSIHDFLNNEGIDSVLPKLYEEGLEKTDGEVLVMPKIYNIYINSHLENIKNSHAVLIANFDKSGVAGYIGANTLVEASFAYALNKKIFLLNDMGKQNARDVMLGMLPISLVGQPSYLITYRRGI